MANGTAATRDFGSRTRNPRRAGLVIGAVVALLASLTSAVALQPGTAGASVVIPAPGVVTTFGVQRQITFSSPFINAISPYDITTGSNGNLWFVYGDILCGCLGELTPSGSLTVHRDPAISEPRSLAIASNDPNGVWFTNFGSSTIGRFDITTGIVTTYSGGGISHPEDIAFGPDGALWFTNYGPTNLALGSIGRITTSPPHTISNFTDPGISNPWQLTAGPFGNNDLWFTNLGNNSVGRIQTNGTVTVFSDPTVMNRPFGITADSGSGTGSGVVYFTNSNDGSIGTIYENPGNPKAKLSDPEVNAREQLTIGPDNALWFGNGSQSIGRATVDATYGLGGVIAFSSPQISGATGLVFGMTVGPDNALWFTSPYDAQVGRFDPAGVPVQPTVTGVGPSAGLVAGGDTVTVTGTGFVAGATDVSFGGVPGTDVVVTSPTSLTVTTPAASGTGPVDVTVTTNGGTSAVTTADQFTYGLAFARTPGSVGTAVIGTPFTAPALTADGGVAPYKFKVTSTAKLPKGLKLNAKTGVIAGTVKAGKNAPAPGTYDFTVTVTDSTKKVKKTASATFSVTLSA